MLQVNLRSQSSELPRDFISKRRVVTTLYRLLVNAEQKKDFLFPVLNFLLSQMKGNLKEKKGRITNFITRTTRISLRKAWLSKSVLSDLKKSKPNNEQKVKRFNKAMSYCDNGERDLRLDLVTSFQIIKRLYVVQIIQSFQSELRIEIIVLFDQIVDSYNVLGDVFKFLAVH